MQIPQEYIDEVRSRTDIVELVGEYVRLKRQGSNFSGLCPFHDEKTPSFNVNPGMGIFKCFGCGVGGDAFKFVMQIENLTFPEAIRLLAERAGVVLPETEQDTAKFSEIESIYHALRFAGRYFYSQLTASDEGKEGLAYLLNRGFTEATIKKYGLGYASPAWDGLLSAATREHITPSVLEKAGLIIPRREKEGHYDRYRDRVMFPIFSHIGKVIGFGGRILNSADNQPKYINSPETQVYHKSSVLYGLYHGKNTIRKKEEVILVEGYTDVLALHQAGLEHAVATSGTALTGDQIKLIKRYAQRVLVLYDADSAGAKAALRGIELLLKQGITVYGLELPQGEDPDSYVRNNGAKAFEEYIQTKKKDFISFMYALAKRRGQLDTPEGEAQVTREIVEKIAQMPDPSMYDPFIRKASQVLDIPDIRLFGVLENVLQQAEKRTNRTTSPPADHREAGSVFYADDPLPPQEPITPEGNEYDPETTAIPQGQDPLPQEKMLLRIMIDQGVPMVEYIMSNMALHEFTEGVMKEAIQHILDVYQAGEKLHRQPFIDGTLGPAVQKLVTDILMLRHEPSENWKRKQNITIPRFNQDPHVAANSAMKQLKRRRVEEALKDLKSRIFQAQRRGEDLTPLLQERMALLQFQKQIEDPEFMAWS